MADRGRRPSCSPRRATMRSCAPPCPAGWGTRQVSLSNPVTGRPPGWSACWSVTPAVISLAALEAGVDLMAEADGAALRTKSRALGSLFAQLVAQRCAGHGLRLASPADDAARGSQICFAHEHGYPIMQALIAH